MKQSGLHSQVFVTNKHDRVQPPEVLFSFAELMKSKRKSKISFFRLRKGDNSGGAKRFAVETLLLQTSWPGDLVVQFPSLQRRDKSHICSC